MERWRDCFRRGFAPLLPTKGLQALAVALETDDPRLCQAYVATNAELMTLSDSNPVQWVMAAQGKKAEATCAATFCLCVGTETVAEANELFARLCFEVDMALGEPMACRWFLSWFDETPRDEMRAALLAEVRLVLAQREGVSA